eukprot:TRINITY_DN22203_c0_g1_i1.p1 TRINITY_DN22203_c0_g1~~TRINITY_DN22203_c0_g1_i1.p1  ORF type:complete len:1189 (-),score=213.62 TRINITY_DN22203_c0_g1_i1:1664-5230(-)
MYFAYGSPLVLQGVPEGEVLAMGHGEEFMIVVSSCFIRIWSTGQQRYLLGEFYRDENILELEGQITKAVFNFAKNMLAIVTSKNYLQIYNLSRITKRSGSLALDPSRTPVDLKLRFSGRLEGPAVTAMIADTDAMLMGLVDGTFAMCSWQGRVKLKYDMLGDLNQGFAIQQMDYSENLQLLSIVASDGGCTLVHTGSQGLNQPEEMVIARQVMPPLSNVMCATFGGQMGLLAVGISWGEVHLFDTNLLASAQEDVQPLRVLSLNDWGHEAGAVMTIKWSHDSRAIAVGYDTQGIAVWSPSGCRLMSSHRQAKRPIQQQSQQLGTSGGSFPVAVEESGLDSFQSGVRALCWDPWGYRLLIAEWNCGGTILQQSFAQLPQNLHRLNWGDKVDSEVQAVLADDRVLLIVPVLTTSNTLETEELVIQHLCPPLAYISQNWPLQCMSISGDGDDIAVAGKNGLAIYNRSNEKWRLFGDVRQERALECWGLGWVGNSIVVTTKQEVLLYPKNYLDTSSLQAKFPLQEPPFSVDCVDQYILVAYQPLMELLLLRVDFTSAGARIELVKELQIRSVGLPITNIALVSAGVVGSDNESGFYIREEEVDEAQYTYIDNSVHLDPQVPTHCLVLRQGGGLHILDMDKGVEQLLAIDVECFWLPQVHEDPELQLPNNGTLTPRIKSSLEQPWWFYGAGGMQLLYPSLIGEEGAKLGGHGAEVEPELEFDREVYPVGISVSDSSIIGITQRMSRMFLGNQGIYPTTLLYFNVVPESQPLLPCLLRRLLSYRAFNSALYLAKKHQHGPHFPRQLEWLLFTALELELGRQSKRLKQQNLMQWTSMTLSGQLSDFIPAASPLTPQPSFPIDTPRLSREGPRKRDRHILLETTRLIKKFPQFSEVVVSVARKTDASQWGALFNAVGSPSRLLEGLISKGKLQSAACCLLVVDKLDGPERAHIQAIRLIMDGLSTSEYDLCAEIFRFITPPSDLDIMCNQDYYELTARNRNSSWMSYLFGTSHNKKLNSAFKIPNGSIDDYHITTNNSAEIARTLIAHHACDLLDSGNVTALANLSSSMSFVKGGLATLIKLAPEVRGEESRNSEDARRVYQALTRINQAYESRRSSFEAQILFDFFDQLDLTQWRIALAIYLRMLTYLVNFKNYRMEIWNEIYGLIQADQSLRSRYGSVLDEVNSLGRGLQLDVE